MAPDASARLSWATPSASSRAALASEARKRAPTGPNTAPDPAPAATRVGHVHLKVADLEGDEGLYRAMRDKYGQYFEGSMGAEAIQRGEARTALCIGAEGTVEPESLIRFSLLSALSTRNEEPARASRPFDKTRDGFVMAEGAAALVLENLEDARARGAEVLGLVLGCGERADSFHRTRSNPSGDAIVGAMRSAIADAGLEPGAIGYVNAHGTGTPENDKMETLGMRAVFGDAPPPISSNKSMIGHTLSAAGAIEAVFSLLSMRDGVLPPTINHETPDPAIGLDVVPNQAREQKVERVLSNSFGFGGQNVCLVLGAAPG